MRPISVVSSFVAALTVAACCFAEDASPGGLAGAVAPYVDGQTLAVFHADLAAFEASGAINVLAEFLHMTDGDRDRLQARVVPLSVLAGSLPPDASADIFIVGSLSDLSAALPVFVVLPLAPGAPSGVIAVELRRHLAKDLKTDITTEQIGGALVTGPPRTVERLKKAPATERPEITSAFEATGDSAVQMLFVPSADARRAFGILFPNLPDELGGGPTAQLARAIEWVAVGISFAGEQTDVRVVVEAADPEAAAKLAGDMTDLLEALGEQDEVRDKIPHFDTLAARLAPEVTGRRLTLVLVADHAEMASLGTLMLPVFRSVEALAAKRASVRRAGDE